MFSRTPSNLSSAINKLLHSYTLSLARGYQIYEPCPILIYFFFLPSGSELDASQKQVEFSVVVCYRKADKLLGNNEYLNHFSYTI